jgi:hypothetical protein
MEQVHCSNTGGENIKLWNTTTFNKFGNFFKS